MCILILYFMDYLWNLIAVVKLNGPYVSHADVQISIWEIFRTTLEAKIRPQSLINNLDGANDAPRTYLNCAVGTVRLNFLLKTFTFIKK